jgi:glutamate 5-kinase
MTSMDPVNGSNGRRPIPDVRRLVVKVGSTSLVDPSGAVARGRQAAVVRQLADALRHPSRSGVLVSSGAIASGLGPLGLPRRPKGVAGLQAAAAVGQGRLMAEYTRLFARHGLVAAQVLLTQDDFIRRRHFVNAQQTFEQLLAARVVPVVNENDTVATEEISFGDNDRLAALVAVMVRADLLVLLSDVDGIFTRDPRRGGALLPEVRDPMAVEARGASATGHGRGGMASKLQAAGMATAAGIPVVVANAARANGLAGILAGEPIGTWIPARGGRQRARRAWVAFVASPSGRIVVDAGAERALRMAGGSLLAPGVVSAEGRFEAGDIVEVVGPDGRAFARGVTNCSSADVPVLLDRGARSSDGGTLPWEREVIHRDELVVMPVDGWSG